MKQNQNAHQHRQGRSNQNHHQKRSSKGRQNRNQQSNSPNRQIDSRGPAGNQRGNAKQLYEKYTALALEKRTSDRLESESLSQHADHYYRVYAEFAATEAANQVAREKEQARKAQIEAERRANAAAADQVKAGEKEKIKTERPSQKKNGSNGLSGGRENKDAPKDLTLDLEGPGESLGAAPEMQEPKKKRGRPAKVAKEGAEVMNEGPKKIIRKPRKKIIPPTEGADEPKSDV